MIRTATGMAAVLAVAGFSSAAMAQKTVTLKLAFFAGAKDSTYSQVVRPWFEDVVAASEGTLKIDAFPGGTLGRNPRVQVKLVQDGVADMAFYVASYTPGRFPDNVVMELPGIIRDSMESSIAIWRLYEKGLLRGYDDYVVPMLTTTFPYTIHTKEPVKKISDLNGLKMRAGGPVAGAAIKALGAVPVGMPIPAVAENISKGIIDGTAADWNVMYAFRIIDVARNHYMSYLGTVPIGILLNKESYAKLPRAAKAAFTKYSGEALSRRFGKVNVAVQKALQAKTEKNPEHTFVFPDAAAQQKWEKLMTPVVDEWAAKHPKGKVLLKALRDELAAIRAGR